MSTVADALQVSRSNLAENLRHERRGRKINREEDERLLGEIRQICDERSTYGYQRVTPLLNLTLENQGFLRANKKRVYRIMKENQLLLMRTFSRRNLVHDGKIITARSDVRWCMDIFGILTWDGTHVWVAFVMDCHDREVINHVASTVGIDGGCIRDMILGAVEQRFGRTQTPHIVQLLSDNGPQFTSRETVSFASSLGFQVCTTPAYSPESNGMAEAFVKTFKRDYVYVNRLESAWKVMPQIAAWVHDYNHHAPHKGLKMRSPIQYRRLTAAG
jgi:transposase InsO family protein